MAVRIVMPKLGDFMTEGIVTFVKSKGDIRLQAITWMLLKF